MRAWKRVHSLRARRLMKLLRRSYAFGRASQLVDEIASDVLPPQGVAIVLTERSGSRCPFWLARPPSERFCSDRGRTSGHCTSRGSLGSRLGFVGDAPPCLRSVTFIPNSAFLSHPTLSSQATSGAGVSCRRGGRRSCDGHSRRSQVGCGGHTPMRHPSPRRPQPEAWHRSPQSSPDYPSSQARRPPRASRPASATPGPKATVFPSSCASRAWFGWRTIAPQSLPLLSAAAPLPRRAASMRRFSLPTPAPKATRPGRARQRSWPRRRSRRTLLLRPRTRKRRSRRAVRTIAATSTSMALHPGARSGSTIGQRAVTRDYQQGVYGRGGFTPNFW